MSEAELKAGKRKHESECMISQEVRCKMKHELQEAPVYQVFTFLVEIYFATMMPVCQVFINGTFLCFSIFLYFYLFDFFVFLIFCNFFWYYQGAYLLGFHQDNDFFQDFLQFLDFFRTCKYLHGSSETKSAVEPLQVESVDRLLEHLSFGC